MPTVTDGMERGAHGATGSLFPFFTDAGPSPQVDFIELNGRATLRGNVIELD
jgi:hypothetical protein